MSLIKFIKLNNAFIKNKEFYQKVCYKVQCLKQENNSLLLLNIIPLTIS